jgi:hypothetical protein
VYTHLVKRYNAEGILRADLLVTLKDRRKVAEARRHDFCLLCRGHAVNEAGLCNACYSYLDGEEYKAAAKWLSGVGP